MRIKHWLGGVAVAAIASVALSGASAQSVGKTLGEVELDGFTQTGAKSFDDLVGRTVLIEFFAYW